MKAHEEEAQTSGDVRPESKQMTQAGVGGALANSNPYDEKNKQ